MCYAITHLAWRNLQHQPGNVMCLDWPSETATHLFFLCPVAVTLRSTYRLTQARTWYASPTTCCTRTCYAGRYSPPQASGYGGRLALLSQLAHCGRSGTREHSHPKQHHRQSSSMQSSRKRGYLWHFAELTQYRRGYVSIGELLWE